METPGALPWLAGSLRPAQANEAPILARVVSDIQPPTQSASAQGSLATSARVQQIWETLRQQGEPPSLPPMPSGSDTTNSDSMSSSSSSSESGEELGVPTRLTNSTESVPPGDSLSPYSYENPKGQMKRDAHESPAYDVGLPSPKRARAESTRMSSTSHISGSIASSPRHSTNEHGGSVARTSSRVPPSASKPNSSTPYVRISVYDLPEQKRHVKVKGNTYPVIVNFNGHSYRNITEANGEQKSASGALIPEHYNPGRDRFYRCPVRGCAGRSEKLHGLGGHFSMSHKGVAFNDNLDGTLSSLGHYKADVTSFPAVVVSRKLNTAVPPPIQSFSPVPLPRQAVDSRAAPRPSSYLDDILSQKHQPFYREDIVFMKSLPHLRNLPKSWETRHASRCPDETLYAILLAFTVGEEVSPAGRCTRFKKMAVSIRIPSGMSQSAKDKLSKVESCVSCLYYNYRRPKDPSPCKWTPGRELQRLGISQSIEGRSRSADSGRSLPSSTFINEEPAIDSSSEEDGEGEEKVEPESPPPRRLLRRPKSHIKDASSTPGLSTSKDASSRMEDWEFAPGKQIDGESGEPFAFSGPYLTSQNAIQVADDIGFHRLRISPGGVHHWKVNKDSLRSCEVISGKLDMKVGDVKAQPIGPGGVFIIRPGMKVTAENRQYNEAVVSCYNFSNYSLAGA